MNSFTVRPAKTSDVNAIRNLVRPLAEERILLDKEAVTYYESIQEFLVAEDPEGSVVGCGGLHVIWEDIAEIRTLATSDTVRGMGVGHLLLGELLKRAKAVGVSRVFCLTFEVAFFERQGFKVMADQSAVDPAVYQEILLSRDEGVAEFLDLARVKPNTLGNTRMIITLD
ncbi:MULTISPECIES: amino-acid N-acetyltransferase [Glutamicibacter]|uniref:amino-acid N-acetyltransferase n=1 Tax=Glutamicibacter TaxID=1742989 RepID=UPI000939C10E|nr:MULTISPECIES: amino-acid N-acetyltransferase [Glutamicibacter]MBM7766982.1 amino-acid N-acetyltransferase [Glutamicibacter nicotianae]UTM48712.1 amino-acid N-acetyltransferase [Glutamicibacter mysorens]